MMLIGPFPLRVLIYYAVGAAAGAVYGSQVCPLLEELHTRILGLVILAPLVLAYGLRGLLSAHFVESASQCRQPRRQFVLELGLIVASGLTSALILQNVYRVPFFQSGLKLAAGLITIALFAGLDLALARERVLILAQQSGKASYDPPTRFSPITRTFFLTSAMILIFATGVMALVLVRDLSWLEGQSLMGPAITVLNRAVMAELAFVMGFLLIMVLNLVYSYSRNLRLLFENQTRVLENVTQGDLSSQVPVISNNELGVIAGHTNTMIRALREGVRMREGLMIASEVQRHFLPDHAPDLPGLELAGTARFSDETGGDFFDFIECEQPDCTNHGIMIGDVSGHGVGAALLMAAGRALIRQSASIPAPLSQRMSMANKYLARDVRDSGRFITLFFMEIDYARGSAAWVNAGQQPPLFFDVATDEFSELKGEDIPMGVEEMWMFHEHVMDLPGPGQVLVMSTDGVWEAMNDAGEMFGGARLKAAIRRSAEKSARSIIQEVVRAVHDFTGRSTQDDDLTLVVIKGVEVE